MSDVQSPPPQKFTSITLAAVAMSLGGHFVRTIEEYGRVNFLIIPPAGVDLTDPTLTVPVGGLTSWVPFLSGKIRAAKRPQGGA